MYYDIILCSDSTDECYVYVLFSWSKRNESELVRVEVYESAEACESGVVCTRTVLAGQGGTISL